MAKAQNTSRHAVISPGLSVKDWASHFARQHNVAYGYGRAVHDGRLAVLAVEAKLVHGKIALAGG
ncbi:MAG: hypothetical protein LBP92_12700 [Deltaproteobacteria bacterium]|nr:hypothetical protein [Deltaproteobacteria bacterium]